MHDDDEKKNEKKETCLCHLDRNADSVFCLKACLFSLFPPCCCVCSAPQPVGFVSFDSRSEAEAAKNALNVSVIPLHSSLHVPLKHQLLVFSVEISCAKVLKKKKKKAKQNIKIFPHFPRRNGNVSKDTHCAVPEKMF